MFGLAKMLLKNVAFAITETILQAFESFHQKLTFRPFIWIEQRSLKYSWEHLALCMRLWKYWNHKSNYKKKKSDQIRKLGRGVKNNQIIDMNILYKKISYLKKKSQIRKKSQKKCRLISQKNIIFQKKSQIWEKSQISQNLSKKHAELKKKN